MPKRMLLNGNNNRVITELPIMGDPKVFYLHYRHGTNPIGSVAICEYDNYVEILHIYVERPHRRKGYASDLISMLKRKYERIITGWIGSESEGRALMFANDFGLVKSLLENTHDYLEWRKE